MTNTLLTKKDLLKYTKANVKIQNTVYGKIEENIINNCKIIHNSINTEYKIQLPKNYTDIIIIYPTKKDQNNHYIFKNKVAYKTPITSLEIEFLEE